jgi:hypothetical protein
MTIKANQGERLAEIILEVGQTERSFALLAGYKHASTIYAVEKGRDISPKLMKRIVDCYEQLSGNKLNPDWLRYGKNPKLLTTSIHLQTEYKVEEDVKLYEKKCKFCQEKDKKIEQLRTELNDLQKDYIQCLKEVSALKIRASG